MNKAGLIIAGVALVVAVMAFRKTAVGQIIVSLKNMPDLDEIPYGGEWTCSLFNGRDNGPSQLLSVEDPNLDGLGFAASQTFNIPGDWGDLITLYTVLYSYTNAEQTLMNDFAACQSAFPGLDDYYPSMAFSSPGAYLIDWREQLIEPA